MPGFAVPAPARTTFSLVAEGLRSIEWHQAKVFCRGGSCPDGGGRWGPILGNGTEVRTRFSSFIELRPSGGTLVGNGTAFALAAGGLDAAISVNGTLRLAQARAVCDCPDPDGATARVLGSSSLSAMRVQEDGRIAAVASVQSLRIDERPPWVPGGAAATAVAAGATAWVLALLLGRILRERGRGRSAVERAVKENPGLPYRGIMQVTGHSDSTVRHHLERLCSEGRVVVLGEGRMARYFENHGRYARTWKEQLMLRDHRLRSLHAWLARNPASPLASIQAAAQGWGVGRGASRKHLLRLVAWGLVERSGSGRGAQYSARFQAAEGQDAASRAGGAGLGGG